MRFAWLRLAVIALLAACGDGGDPSATTINGSIRGTVTDNAGASVANAAVALTGNAQAARTTNTDADGVYTFADVLPGTYTLTVTPPTGFTLGVVGTATVTVASKAQANASAFVLNRIVNGSITGTVSDIDAAAGLTNAAVALTGNGQTPRTTNTGAGGVYTFADLPPGTYSLAVTPPSGFTPFSQGTTSVTVANGAQATALTFSLRHDSCQVKRPDFGGAATAEDLALFAYDVNAPLNLQQTVVSDQDGVQVSNISYTSPDGGSVTGIIAEPVGRTGLRPGLIIMQPFSGTQQVPYAKQFAHAGAVVIVIDAPGIRRGGGTIPVFTIQDRMDQIQLVKDLRRAIDVLTARADVDDARIGYLGNSYGGAAGALLVGVDHRLKAAILAVANGGYVTHLTGAANFVESLAALSCSTRNAWIGHMTPIEAIRFIPHASGTELLFQIAKFDTAILPEDSQALYDAAPNPKEARFYESGHNLNLQALSDRMDWLREKIGLDEPAP